MELERVGFWAPDSAAAYPDPHLLVDESWSSFEREQVVDYLSRGFVARAFMGRSSCRFCGQPNGNLELTDGHFLWPEGLAHYVETHAVRLPEYFVSHVSAFTDAVENAEIITGRWPTGS